MKNKKKLKIYFDKDDVGNKLAKHIIEIYNREMNDDFDWKESEEFMIAKNIGLKADNDYFNEILHREGTFLNAEPHLGYAEVIERLILEGYEVRILTHPQWNSKYCLNEKIEWIKKYLPFFDLNNLIMTRLKGEVASENKILIDDNPKNLKDWEENGGIGICFSKMKYSEEWEGHKVKNFEEVYDLIHLLEEE